MAAEFFCSGTQYSVFNFSGYLCLPNRRDHGHYWVCETDFSGYPDCRDEFVQAMNQALAKGMDLPLMIRTPLMWLNKAETWHWPINWEHWIWFVTKRSLVITVDR